MINNVVQQQWGEAFQLFVSYDTDPRDGSLSASELSTLINHTGLPVSLADSSWDLDEHNEPMTMVELFYGLVAMSGFVSQTLAACTGSEDCATTDMACNLPPACHDLRCFPRPPLEDNITFCIAPESGLAGTCQKGSCTPSQCTPTCAAAGVCMMSACVDSTCQLHLLPAGVPCTDDAANIPQGICTVEGTCVVSPGVILQNSPCDPLDCRALLDNSVCDSVCNHAECGYDGLDCRAPLVCGPNTFCAPRFSDGHCDALCNTTSCLLDGGDCDPKPAPVASTIAAVLYILASPTAMAHLWRHLQRGLEATLHTPVSLILHDTKDDLRRDGVSRAGASILAVNMEAAVHCFVGLSCFQDPRTLATFLNAQAGSPRLAMQLGVQLVGAVPVAPRRPSDNELDGGSGALSSKAVIAISVPVLVLLSFVALVGAHLRADRKRRRRVADLGTELSLRSRTPGDGAEPSCKKLGTNVALEVPTERAVMSAWEQLKTWVPSELEALDVDLCNHGLGPLYSSVLADLELPAVMASNAPPRSICETPLTPPFTPPDMLGMMSADLGENDGNVDIQPACKLMAVDRFATFLLAAQKGELLLLKAMLPQDISQQDENGDTALHLAGRHAQLVVLRFLLAAKAPVNLRNVLGSTPLHEAVRAGDTASAILLLSNGADPNLACNVGLTPIMSAIIHQRHSCFVPLYNARARLDLCDSNGWQAVHWAAALNDIIALEFLLRGKVNVNVQNHSQETPLIIAAKENNEQFVLALLQRFAKRNIEDCLGRTALTMARERGHAHVTMLLEDWTLYPGASGITQRQHITCNPTNAAQPPIYLPRSVAGSPHSAESDPGALSPNSSILTLCTAEHSDSAS